ncbi:unnamed protein product [Protopolystoma xenopodis]|uniref:Uncharacterized protein n=1 Tax=Protopolystoma xenopodis TaxID=117903 RepID=A0A3S5BPR9_9PLAT|nr:unnamed protein product [Protopolystoma xenopodis]
MVTHATKEPRICGLCGYELWTEDNGRVIYTIPSKHDDKTKAFGKFSSQCSTSGPGLMILKGLAFNQQNGSLGTDSCPDPALSDSIIWRLVQTHERWHYSNMAVALPVTSAHFLPLPLIGHLLSTGSNQGQRLLPWLTSLLTSGTEVTTRDQLTELLRRYDRKIHAIAARCQSPEGRSTPHALSKSLTFEGQATTTVATPTGMTTFSDNLESAITSLGAWKSFPSVTENQAPKSVGSIKELLMSDTDDFVGLLKDTDTTAEKEQNTELDAWNPQAEAEKISSPNRIILPPELYKWLLKCRMNNVLAQSRNE